MIRRITFALACTLASCAGTHTVRAQGDDEKSQRMQWFRDARFGMFIHWGLYSIPAGKWGDSTNHAEWIRETAHIPIETYDQFVQQFNPVKFDARKWAKLAHDAGMKYVVITSKHHDGFALFDSKVSDYDVMATPFKRDILKELSEAVRGEGLTMCFYHSIMDWHHPDYLPRRSWETRSAAGADFNRYVRYLHAQVSELLTQYGPVGILWFDGEWESTWTHELGVPLYELCRKLQPSVIVNNRVDKGRGGMGGMSDAGFAGDYGTPEQEIPATGMPGVDWETCMTMNNNWGYNQFDKNFKSTADLIHKLCDIASKGGNFLLNVGPTAEGEIPPESVERLQQIGKWMSVNGEAIYGTQASPFDNLSFGRCTQKKEGDRTILYFHVFDWPKDGKLKIAGLGNRFRKPATLLARPGDLPTAMRDGELTISVTDRPPDTICSVVRLEIEGVPIVYKPPVVYAPSDVFVNSLDVELSCASSDMAIRYTLDGSEPTATSPLYQSPIHIVRDTEIRAAGFHGGRAVSHAAPRRFARVDPWPAMGGPGAKAGLNAIVMDHRAAQLPTFDANRKPLSWTDDVSIPKEVRRENVAMKLSGRIRVEKPELYQFRLTSDDGSRLRIDGRVIVDNDGNHPSLAKTGVAPLAAGTHSIEVEWYNGPGDMALKLEWAQPGESFHTVPPAAFTRD